MPDTTNQIKVSGNEVVNTTVFPDTKLQTLDRRVGKDQLYFDRRLFEETVADWSDKPIIYHPDGIHPTDFAAVNRDPVSAAEAIGGKLVGSVRNPRIVVPGGARLMAELDIDEGEHEILRLWQQGKLFPSTAFMANTDGDRLTSPPIPNHVLLFPIKVDEVLPGDPGAFVNTLEVTMKDETDKKKACNTELEEQPTPLDDVKSDIAGIKADIASLKEQVSQPKEVTNSEEAAAEEATAEVARNLEDEIKWRDEEIARLKAEIEAFKAGKAALEEKIAGMEATALEAEFNSIVEKLPVGMKSTPEQIEALYTQFIEGNTKAMLFTLLNTSQETGSTHRVGQPFTQSVNVADDRESVGDLNKPKKHQE